MNYTMLDIGQGDCNILSGRGMETVMIDCGSSSEKEIAKYRVLPYLKYMGIREVNAVILTHTDNDHISGFLEILDIRNMGGIRIKNLILPEIGDPDEKYGKLISSAGRAGIRVSKISAGSSFSVGGMDFICLGPGKGFHATDPNEYSAVVKMKYGEFSALFTGDIQGEGENEMIGRLSGKEKMTVLKVAHHGSRNSTPEEFLDIIRPEASLISSGRNNSYGHPHSELLERLEEVNSAIFRTAYGGAITVRSDGHKAKIKQYLRQKEEEENEKSFN
ncbi:MAG: MBL fold metallo-hydrolase [Lachnospiraceae bacterium]|nr:MBL fold metallo-hydrolase [Lachnospiraceae bacterium]